MNVDLSLPTVYIVPETQTPHGDVAGSLLHENGEVTWGHMSSSIGWLAGDLTTNFKDRREALEARYPDGYEVVVCGEGVDIPADVLAANHTWAETQDGDEA